MKIPTNLTTLCLCLLPGMPNAQESELFGFSVGISSVGLTGEIAYQVNEKWRLRAMLSGAPNYRSGKEAGDITYDTVAKLRGLSLLADRKLGSSNWRLTFGGFLSDSVAIGTASGPLQIGDTFYPAASLTAKARFEIRFSPILAIGYDHDLDDRWTLSGSLGYIYTGGFDIKLTGSVGVSEDDLITETLDAESDFIDGYPFVELSLYYRF